MTILQYLLHSEIPKLMEYNIKVIKYKIKETNSGLLFVCKNISICRIELLFVSLQCFRQMNVHIMGEWSGN